MTLTIQALVLLLAVTSAVALAAKRLRVPPAILLVLAGVVLAIVPGLPAVQLAPEFVLFVVLPPLIYSSAVAMSWREFKFNLRPISLLAIGCVLFTTLAVAALAHWLLGFDWAVGFVLGAIVSPPDAVAPLSVLQRLQIPRRIVVILEGEGLANDATALIVYRFAVTAVSAGAFSFGQASAQFATIVVGEILWGIGVGWVMLRLRRWVNDPRIEVTLSILTPYLVYWPPDYLGGSGVLATLTAGLYISWNGPLHISAATRLQGIFFWDLFIYLIESVVFLVTGLQARTLIARIGDYSIAGLAGPAALVSLAVIAARFIWMFPATYLPRKMFAGVRKRDPAPPWQWPFLLAFTGVRGVVSLVAALAIPLALSDGRPFPDRDLILFLTFSVILVTLVVQGLLLPPVVRALGLANAGRRERHTDLSEEREARRLAIQAAITRLDELKAERHLEEHVVRPLRAHDRDRLEHAHHQIDGDDGDRQLNELRDELELLLIGAERQAINELFREGKLKDEARRRIERELDLREADLANQRDEPLR